LPQTGTNASWNPNDVPRKRRKPWAYMLAIWTSTFVRKPGSVAGEGEKKKKKKEKRSKNIQMDRVNIVNDGQIEMDAKLVRSKMMASAWRVSR
jgi:hypothetical protein